MRRPFGVVATVAIIAICWGCGATADQLRDRASFDFDCPQDELDLHEIDDRTMGVEGCDRRATYIETCRQGKYGPYNCSWVLNAQDEDIDADERSLDP